jgi:hypothetical protein
MMRRSNLITEANPMNVPVHALREAKQAILSAGLAVLLVLVILSPASAQVQKISTDKFTNSDSVHQSEVEPDTFSWGNTIVSTSQVARRPGTVGWGSADIGFSTSTDGGLTWTYGYLPGLTVNYKGGKYYGAADPSVAYDAKHGVWMISYLPLINPIGDVGASTSTDGIHWGNPVIIDSTHLDDKNWTVCDNTPSSPFYGNCYTEYDAALGNGQVLMSVSSDGGKTWGAGKGTKDKVIGLGGQPVVQTNGTVVVPFLGGGINVFTSTDGGQTWGASKLISTEITHGEAGGLRNPGMPSAEVDGAGTVYVAWADCRFRTGCSSNDIVMSTSADGVTWSSPARIPIDDTTSTVDHFIPGMGVDHNTSGSAAHLAVVYYYYPVSKCNSSCQLYVGYTTSQDGGATWTAGKQLAGPMQLSWLPLSDLGPMVADYISVSYANGNAYGVFAVAKAPNGSTLNQAMYANRSPLFNAAEEAHFSSKNDKPVPGAKADHEMKFYLDDEGKYPIPADKLIQQQKQ